jgi:peptidoglycan hydrolase-like amidase
MLALAFAATVHIGVLGSYHPSTLEVSAPKGSALVVQTQGRSESIYEKHTKLLTGPAKVTGRNGTMTRITLGIPGGMHRDFIGRLEIKRQNGALTAIVEMDLETAVAAIVAAEGSTSIPYEARKAQAVATRSYLVGAHDRHEFFDFCDTEHCQLLHDLQPIDNAASQAAKDTQGIVITYHDAVVPALYHASCGGHTKTLAKAGWQTENYPYFAVMCPRKGTAAGHGVGLCQLGAIELAKRGVGYEAILAHYFPQTKLEKGDTIAHPEHHGVQITRRSRPVPAQAKVARSKTTRLAHSNQDPIPTSHGGRAYQIAAIQ